MATMKGFVTVRSDSYLGNSLTFTLLNMFFGFGGF